MDRAEWDARYQTPDLVWSAQPNQFLVTEVSDLPAGRALDLACGEGRNAVWLAERGWDVTGVDFSPVGLTKAAAMAEKAGVAVTWVEADLAGYEPAPGAFDLVVVMYLHASNVLRRTVLRRAAAALAPGGTLLVVGHHRINLERGVGGPQDPEVLFTPEDVVADVEGTPGLAVVKAETVTRTVESGHDHHGRHEPGAGSGEAGTTAYDALVRVTVS